MSKGINVGNLLQKAGLRVINTQYVGSSLLAAMRKGMPYVPGKPSHTRYGAYDLFCDLGDLNIQNTETQRPNEKLIMALKDLSFEPTDAKDILEACFPNGCHPNGHTCIYKQTEITQDTEDTEDAEDAKQDAEVAKLDLAKLVV